MFFAVASFCQDQELYLVDASVLSPFCISLVVFVAAALLVGLLVGCWYG